MAQNSLSVCIITLNEERMLGGCLESVGFADDIVVVDSHSTDRTREIARQAGARVVKREFHGYGDQKNFAVGLARHSWCLCLDADERVSPELKESLTRALQSNNVYSGYMMNLRSRLLGRWIKHGGLYPNRKLRLFHREHGTWDPPSVHEVVKVEGKVGRLKGDLLHESYASVSDHVRRVDHHTTLMARHKNECGERFHVHQLILRPPVTFLKMYFWRAGFRDGVAGLVLAVKGAFDVFLKYAKLWELQR